MYAGIPTEVGDGERRVAGTPDTVRRLIKLGFDVKVQRGAGTRAALPDADYEAAGAQLVDDPAEIWASELVLKIEPPTDDEVERLHGGSTLVCMLSPDTNGELLSAIAARGATALALDKIPRISRAQKMDVLSSMANIAGYRSVIEAAHRFGRFFGVDGARTNLGSGLRMPFNSPMLRNAARYNPQSPPVSGLSSRS